MSDRLSPILVKELRQGLRARVFEWSFLVMQSMIVFAMITALSAAATDQHQTAKNFGEVLFWAMVGIPLLLIMPMRGTAALRPEIESKSLELIFLTRLSAWRIVTGKWAALFCQTCLLVCAILPYTVLRYYLGNVDVARDLAIVLGLLGASALFTALTVSVSAFPSKLARGMVIVFPILLLNIGPFVAASIGFFSGYGSVTGAPRSFTGIWGDLSLLLAYVVLVSAYMLEVGAARIAPPAENHAIAKRILGLGLLALGPIAVLLGLNKDVLLVTLAVMTPICVDALCAPSRTVPGVYLPFLRRRGGRWIAPFLLPGWPSGVLYCALVYVLCGAMLQGWGLLTDAEIRLAFVSLGAALCMPVAAILLARPRIERFGTAYIAAQLALIIFTGIFIMLNKTFDWNADMLLSVIPVSTLLLTMADESNASWLAPTVIVFAFSIAVIASRMVAGCRQLRATYAAAVALYKRRQKGEVG